MSVNISTSYDYLYIFVCQCNLRGVGGVFYIVKHNDLVMKFHLSNYMCGISTGWVIEYMKMVYCFP
jgi:hypothetical protein